MQADSPLSKLLQKMSKNIFPTGNRTLVCRVTGGDTNHYTIGNEYLLNIVSRVKSIMNMAHRLATCGILSNRKTNESPAPFAVQKTSKNIKKLVTQPGIEPGSQPWQG
jgi:hypothetical protein